MWNNAVLRICLLHFAEQKEERQPMETTTVDKDQIENTTAEHIRSLLHNAGIFTISVVGGPGSGKTALIDATIRALAPEIRIAAIACDIVSCRDADCLACHCHQVVPVKVGERGIATAKLIYDAVNKLDLKQIDLLFIENVGSLAGPIVHDLGQDVTVAIFSVSAGDDKADKHPDIVRASNLMVLNKTDLIGTVPFNVSAFRADVVRLNPEAELFEVSALQQWTLGSWLNRLSKLAGKEKETASFWFSESLVRKELEL